MADRLPRVLVVDDEPAVLRVASRVVRSLGFDTVEAGSLADAVRVATAERPDVALVDLHLGDASGMAVAQGMRAGAPGLPLVFASGGVDDALQRGLAPYGPLVSKPFDREALRRVLQAAVDHGSRPT